MYDDDWMSGFLALVVTIKNLRSAANALSNAADCEDAKKCQRQVRILPFLSVMLGGWFLTCSANSPPIASLIATKLLTSPLIILSKSSIEAGRGLAMELKKCHHPQTDLLL